MNSQERLVRVQARGYKNHVILNTCPVCGWGKDHSRVKVRRSEGIERIETSPAGLTFECWLILYEFAHFHDDFYRIHVGKCTRQDRQSFLIPYPPKPKEEPALATDYEIWQQFSKEV